MSEDRRVFLTLAGGSEFEPYSAVLVDQARGHFWFSVVGKLCLPGFEVDAELSHRWDCKVFCSPDFSNFYGQRERERPAGLRFSILEA